MRRILILAAGLTATLLLLSLPQSRVEADGPEPVFVTNLPAVQTVDGEVEVAKPIPQTRLVSKKILVSPGSIDNPNSYTDAGVLDASGFAGVALSLGGITQGRTARPGAIGAILLPDLDAVEEALQVHGIHQFALRAATLAHPTESGIFQSEPVHHRLSFPRYRVYLYNETTRTAEVTLYLYLGS